MSPPKNWKSGAPAGSGGDVTTVAFSTEEGAFLRGQIRMEEKIELEIDTEVKETEAQS